MWVALIGEARAAWRNGDQQVARVARERDANPVGADAHAQVLSGPIPAVQLVDDLAFKNRDFGGANVPGFDVSILPDHKRDWQSENAPKRACRFLHSPSRSDS